MYTAEAYTIPLHFNILTPVRVQAGATPSTARRELLSVVRHSDITKHHHDYEKLYYNYDQTPLWL